MKLALIIPNNLWFCPYVSIYTRILDNCNVEYDIISWNRDGSESLPLQYNKSLNTRNKIHLMYAYFQYAKYVKNILRRDSYEKLIVFTPQVGIFLSLYLWRFYKNKYIFDYRDLSIEQSFYFKLFFHLLLQNSFCNCISSPGFKEYLPRKYNYILSHNFDITQVKKRFNCNKEDNICLNSNIIEVLTIGGIRDFESNVDVINVLANKSKYYLSFIGKGPSAEKLECYSKKLRVENILFKGYYRKEEERDYVKKSTFLNIYYPRRPSHDTALSNRFYNSLIYKRPMIVTANTTQGNFVSKYNVGIAIENCVDLDEKLVSYLNNLDLDKYVEQCNKLLFSFVEDYNYFEKNIKFFIHM